MSKSKTHSAYYISLILILALGFFLILQNQYGRAFQLTAAVLTAIFYCLWGIVHHYVHHDITAKIVLEYVLIASLGMSVILFLLKGL